MAIEITVPRLGWSMDEGVFGEWLKKEGEVVHKGDMVFMLEGEKAVHEIESFDAGILHLPEDTPKPGDQVKVGQIIGFLLAEGESPPASKRSSAVSSNQTKPIPPTVTTGRHRLAGPAARRLARQLGVDLDAVPTPDPTGRVLCEDVQNAADHRRAEPMPSPAGRRIVASPRARHKGEELGVDWTKLTGSGRNGRIRERDVITFAEPSLPSSTRQEAPVAPGTLRPASRIRRVIAQRMLASTWQAAPVTLTTKVDATALVAFRNRLKAEIARPVVPSYSDIIVKLAARALLECPELNACWRTDGIVLYDEINIALAVDTDAGLVVPVIKNVQSLSLEEVAKQSRKLAEDARAGKLSESQLRGGTFTVTNLGSFEIDFFTPILNLPQSGILGIGRIVREPVVRGNEVVPGETLTLSLTFDHRVLDGAPAARWLQRLSQMIQQPAE